MKRMGLGIVYADYNRIFINSNKYTYDNAKQAIAYELIFLIFIELDIFLIQFNQKMFSDLLTIFLKMFILLSFGIILLTLLVIVYGVKKWKKLLP